VVLVYWLFPVCCKVDDKVETAYCAIKAVDILNTLCVPGPIKLLPLDAFCAPAQRDPSEPCIDRHFGKPTSIFCLRQHRLAQNTPLFDQRINTKWRNNRYLRAR
jgi:hypothetical protein